MSDSIYDLEFIKTEYNSDLLVSEYLRKHRQEGLKQSEIKIFEHYIEKNNKVLDIGCGVGRISFGLYKMGYKNVCGCDIAPNMIKYAKKENKIQNTNIKFFVHDICSKYTKKDKFDVAIFSFNGLMCIPKYQNRLNAVHNIHDMLNDNGLFIFTCHDREKIPSMAEFFKEEKGRWDNNTQQENLIDFGDVEYPDKFASFLHIPNQSEIMTMLSNCKFDLVNIIEKYKITDKEHQEKEKTENYFYYIARKRNSWKIFTNSKMD